MEWSIQGCASQSWTPPQGRCKRSAARPHPDQTQLIIQGAFLYQGRSRWELKVGRAVCLPVEGDLVDDRNLKAGDLGLAIFLAEPIERLRETMDLKENQTTCKEVSEKSVQRLQACGNPCWEWCGWSHKDLPQEHRSHQPEMSGVTKEKYLIITLFFSNNFWVRNLCNCCIAVPVVSQNLTDPSAWPVTEGKMCFNVFIKKTLWLVEQWTHLAIHKQQLSPSLKPLQRPATLWLETDSKTEVGLDVPWRPPRGLLAFWSNSKNLQ